MRQRKICCWVQKQKQKNNNFLQFYFHFFYLFFCLLFISLSLFLYQTHNGNGCLWCWWKCVYFTLIYLSKFKQSKYFYKLWKFSELNICEQQTPEKKNIQIQYTTHRHITNNKQKKITICLWHPFKCVTKKCLMWRKKKQIF